MPLFSSGRVEGDDNDAILEGRFAVVDGDEDDVLVLAMSNDPRRRLEQTDGIENDAPDAGAGVISRLQDPSDSGKPSLPLDGTVPVRKLNAVTTHNLRIDVSMSISKVDTRRAKVSLFLLRTKNE